MYHNQDYDLAGFAVGAVERSKILPTTTQSGDVLLGLASSGLHSNGYSLARYILSQNNLNFQSVAYNKQTFGEVLLTPTKIYVKSCLSAIKTGKVKALAHITGGGLTENLPRVLSKHISPKINYHSWQWPEIFNILQKLGKVNNSEMLRTFNCGIGMVLVVDKNDANDIASLLTSQQEQVFFIGELV
jgi:phosphoribosylaminoimidazole synthetase